MSVKRLERLTGLDRGGSSELGVVKVYTYPLTQFSQPRIKTPEK